MWTNKTCLVGTFFGEYGATTDTKICSGATVWISDKGEVYIIIFEPGLWFGSRMERFLINNNQCSSFFIQIYDDTNYPNREIALFTKNISIPISMYWLSDMIMTITHTDKDLGTCPYITISDKYKW